MKTQEYDELTNIDKEIDCETVYFCFSFCRFVKEFDCFKISTFVYLDVIVSIECIFREFSRLLSCFEPSLNLITHCNVQLKSFCMNDMMKRNIQRIYLINTTYEKELPSKVKEKEYFFFINFWNRKNFWIDHDGK
jgi:hypothetical protein